MMNFTSNHCGISIGFYLKACYPVSVYVATFKVTLKNTEIKPVAKTTFQKENTKKLFNVHLKIKNQRCLRVRIKQIYTKFQMTNMEGNVLILVQQNYIQIP